MDDGTGSGFSLRLFSAVSLVGGIGFFCWCLFFGLPGWPHKASALIGLALFSGGLTNVAAAFVLRRMQVAGYQVGYRRWMQQDFKLYTEYWRIAPLKNWSRWILVALVAGFVLGIVFMLLSLRWVGMF
jgi:hypothetical protein